MRVSSSRMKLAVCACAALLAIPGATSDVLQSQFGISADLKAIQLPATNGQILSYRYNKGPTEVYMRGTGLAAEARIKLKVESRPGFLEIDINRGDINKLRSADRYGRDFLTYVLWAVSVAGKASNLGEITFSGRRAISINVTTPYQTFWLMVTAEPDFAVADPSPQVVLYSVDPESIGKTLRESAEAVEGELFYYTHYVNYETSPGRKSDVPNELQQARKAIELAARSGILAIQRPAGAPVSLDEQRTRKAFTLATNSLAKAERTYKTDRKSSNVLQDARTAAQIAENARALAVGAVGGMFIGALEKKVAQLQTALAKARGPRPATRPVADSDDPESAEEDMPLSEIFERDRDPISVAKPVVWFGFLGWGLALLLLLRRQPT